MVTSAWLLLLASCKDTGTGPATPPDNIPLLSLENYHKIAVQLVDYDVVRITHQSGNDLKSSTVRQITIGSKTGAGFTQLAVFPSTYDSVARTYNIHFDFTVAMDSSKLVQPLTVRYHASDSTDIDTSVALYKYPYASVEIFMDSTLVAPGSYQDVALNDQSFFFHTWSLDGLHQYNLVTHQSSNPYGYYGGSHISANSDYVFCDINHHEVVRFNLNSATPDLMHFGNRTVFLIEGLAVSGQSLTMLIFNGSQYLLNFTLDGVLMDSIPFPNKTPYFMALHDSVLYCKDEDYALDAHGNQIMRFSLRTRTLLSNARSPSRTIAGMEVVHDTLFFCDPWKKFVGVMPVANLLSVQ